MSYTKIFNERAQKQHLMLSMSGDVELAGLQSLNNISEENKPEHRRRKKKEKQYRDFLQLLTETQIKLQDFIEEIDLKLLQARQDLEQHKELFAERIALERCIDVLTNDGLLERNADGSLKDKDLERAVTRYLKDNNMSTDLSDDARIYAIAQNLITTYPTQGQLLSVIDIDDQIIQTLQDGKDQAQTLQRILNDPDLSEQEMTQISSQADRLSQTINSDVSSLFTKRDTTLSSDHKLQTCEEPKGFVDDINNGLQKRTSVELHRSELPTPDLNF